MQLETEGKVAEAVPATQEEVATIWAQEVALREGTAPETKPLPIAVVKTEAPVAEPAKDDVVADPMAGLPLDIKTKLEAFDKLADRMRNLEGHIGGLTDGQKKIRELLTASQEAAKKTTEAPSQAAVAAAAADPEKWANLKKDFPDWSEGVEALLDVKIAGIPKPTIDTKDIDRRIDEVPSRLRREIAEDVLDATPEFAGWRDKITTPQFVDWYNAQTDEVKKLAQSDKFSDAAKMLRLYKPVVAVDPAVKSIKDARKDVLESATGAPKGKQVAAPKGLEEMSAQEVWNMEAKKRDKARGFA